MIPKFRVEEYEVLKELLDDKWKWIARDGKDNGNGKLFAYTKKPHKKYDREAWAYSTGFIRPINNHLFRYIQWEDEEPYNIVKLIEEYKDSISPEIKKIKAKQ